MDKVQLGKVIGIIILALTLLLGAFGVKVDVPLIDPQFPVQTVGVAHAQEPTGDPPPLPEPWNTLIPFECGNIEDVIGLVEISNGVSECSEGVLASCLEDGLIGNSDCRGIAQATAVFALNNEAYAESFSSYAWRRYDFGLCVIADYNAQREAGTFVGTEAEFVAGSKFNGACGGSPVLFGVSDASLEDLSKWLEEAYVPHDGNVIGDPNTCSVWPGRLCGSSGDTNPANAGFVCADGSAPKAVPLNGEDWTCESGDAVQAEPVVALPSAGSGGYVKSGFPVALLGFGILAVFGLGLLKRSLRI